MWLWAKYYRLLAIERERESWCGAVWEWYEPLEALLYIFSSRPSNWAVSPFSPTMTTLSELPNAAHVIAPPPCPRNKTSSTNPLLSINGCRLPWTTVSSTHLPSFSLIVKSVNSPSPVSCCPCSFSQSCLMRFRITIRASLDRRLLWCIGVYFTPWDGFLLFFNYDPSSGYTPIPVYPNKA
jgi:hypothetical protein